MLRTAIQYMLVEGRDTGTLVYGNAQDYFNQIPEHVRVHFQKLYIGKQSSKSANRLNEVASIPLSIIEKIPRLEQGAYIGLGGGDFHYPIFVPPTRHKKKEEGFDVLQFLTNQYGSHEWKTDNLFKQTFKIYDNEKYEPFLPADSIPVDSNIAPAPF